MNRSSERFALAPLIVTFLAGCAATTINPLPPLTASPRAQGTLLGERAGEALFFGREREPTLIKVDSANAGAREMVVMLRVLDPGASFGRHRFSSCSPLRIWLTTSGASAPSRMNPKEI